MKIPRHIARLLWVSLFLMPLSVYSDSLTLSLQDVEINVVMKMLSKHEKINIFVANGVQASVSVNIYNMETMDAIHSIAESAGFVAELRGENVFIIKREDAGKFRNSSNTEVRTFKVQYTAISDVEEILKQHLSSFGSIKALTSNKTLIIQDTPEFLDNIEVLLGNIDREPRQILIEAKILEIILTDNQSFGFNWAKLFSGSSSSGSIGTQGLANPASPGLFAQYTNANINMVLNALKERQRLRTLSTPKLLAMEGYEAETVVGTRLGFKVTTTANQVTSESIEFLETGIILKVTPSVDRNGQILLDIHPEVSAGSVSDDGIPSKTTTQLSTRMLVPNGKTVFMGGLIRHSNSQSRESVPVLGDVPLIGGLFSNDANNTTMTEIIVLLTPTIIDYKQNEQPAQDVLNVEALERMLEQDKQEIKKKMRKQMGDSDTFYSGAGNS